MDLLEYLSEKPKPVILTLAFALVVIVGLLDYNTVISFELFYFVPILLATWFAGRAAGVGTAVACASAKLVADVLPAIYPLNPDVARAILSRPDPLLPYWNGGMKLLLFLFVAQTVTAIARLRSQQEAERVA